MKRSPLAPARFPDLPDVAGVRLATAAAGVRYQSRDDVMLAVLDGVVAGVLTRSATRSAPVLDCAAKLPVTGPCAILVNAGNANAFTGRAGEQSVRVLCDAVSDVTDIAEAQVLTSSTGVIGERLDHDRIVATLETLHSGPSATWEAAATAIGTTDTYPKGAVRTVTIDGTPVNIAGIAKGSGMIAPDMATMLVYIFTDAAIGAEPLTELTRRLTDRTFNCITVDSDTSTSDTLLVGATGRSGVDVTGHPAFESALAEVFLDLAHQVVRDGEGATKFVTVTVTGADTNADARTIGLAVANSPLVKTAMAGSDPNWGRVIAAIGKSGAKADRDRLSLWFGDLLVAEKGWVADSYREEDGAAYMQRDDVTMTIDLGLGDGTATVWTCDLTHGYITINADYRS